MAVARAGRARARYLTKDRKSREAAELAAEAQAELAAEMVATWPLLTAAQREQLRPILSGSIPAEHVESAA